MNTPPAYGEIWRCRPWIYKLAGIYSRNFPSWIRRQVFEDLLAAGWHGAVIGASRFDAVNGAKYLTYAQHWVRAIMGRCYLRLLDELKGKRSVQSLGEYDDYPAAGAGEPDVQHDFDDEWWEQALSSLSDRYRTVICLRFRHGYTVTEIGRKLGRSKQRIQQIIARGLELLRPRFARTDELFGHTSRFPAMRDLRAGPYVNRDYSDDEDPWAANALRDWEDMQE